MTNNKFKYLWIYISFTSPQKITHFTYLTESSPKDCTPVKILSRNSRLIFICGELCQHLLNTICIYSAHVAETLVTSVPSRRPPTLTPNHSQYLDEEPLILLSVWHVLHLLTILNELASSSVIDRTGYQRRYTHSQAPLPWIMQS
jgi:hypothetical protein